MDRWLHRFCPFLFVRALLPLPHRHGSQTDGTPSVARSPSPSPPPPDPARAFKGRFWTIAVSSGLPGVPLWLPSGSPRGLRARNLCGGLICSPVSRPASLLHTPVATDRLLVAFCFCDEGYLFFSLQRGPLTSPHFFPCAFRGYPRCALPPWSVDPIGLGARPPPLQALMELTSSLIVARRRVRLGFVNRIPYSSGSGFSGVPGCCTVDLS